MMYVFEVLGPQWIEKTVTVAYDDVAEDLSLVQMKEMAIEDAKYELRKGFSEREFIYKDIHQA